MGIFLAPMAGVTDLPFRIIAREFGADLVVSEMISARALTLRNPKTLKMLAIDKGERPAAVQLFGHDPKIMAQASELACRYVRPEMIDLNFGCPTPKVVKNGDGAALLQNPALLAEIALAVKKAADVPVTAKIRLGWDQQNINCVEIAKRLEQSGMHWITVHGRTREQFYAGQADWEWIARVKNAVRLPIVGNGDVFSGADAQALFSRTKCDHLAVGRGARGNPWIFKQIKARLKEGLCLPPPSVEERAALALRHLMMKVEYDGEARAVKEMRPHLMWYLKGTAGSAQLRNSINTASALPELKKIIEQLL